MKKTGFIYDDVFLRHEPPSWHPDSRERLTSIISALKDAGIWDQLVHIKPRKAGADDIVRVHNLEYLDRIRNAGQGELDPDTFMSRDSFDAAVHAAGAVLEAVDQCRKKNIERAFCAVRPPGHHAEAGQAMGFCLINNIAVGARFAQTIGYHRVFIIDFDAHHGNGTQHIFEEDDTVYYFSTHQHPYYPETGRDGERGTGRGLGYTYNFPVPAGAGNREFITVYQNILPGLVQRFVPDIVLVSAGYDIHVNDSHANIRVSDEGVRAIVRSILDSASVPVVFVLEGGYELVSLGDSVRITVQEMLK